MYVVHSKTAVGAPIVNEYRTLPDLLRALPLIARVRDQIVRVEKRLEHAVPLDEYEQAAVANAIGSVTRVFDVGVVRS